MRKLQIMIVLALFSATAVIVSSAPFGAVDPDEDLIDLSNITVFPKDYAHNIRAGYLNLTAYNQAFYYLFCERYKHS